MTFQNDMRGLMTLKHSACAERGENENWNVGLDASPVFPILDRIGRARSLRVPLAQHARVPHLVEENGQHPDRKGLRHALISLGGPNRVDSRELRDLGANHSRHPDLSNYHWYRAHSDPSN